MLSYFNFDLSTYRKSVSSKILRNILILNVRISSQFCLSMSCNHWSGFLLNCSSLAWSEHVFQSPHFL